MRRAAVVLGAVSLVAAACQRPLPELPVSQVPPPAPAAVQSVLFLVGDAGYANEARDPIFNVLRSDVEYWSGGIARDSAVMVLWLGDIIYPAGMHDASDPIWANDSSIVQSQVNMVAGPNARRYRSIGYFLAGNHDWGNARDITGIARLKNLEEFLDRRRAAGVHVRLVPEAGEPGPAVVDYGSTRLLLYDTAWWLLSRDTSLKGSVGRRTREALRTAGTRNVVVGAHHPFRSASSHGGLIPFWKGIGLRYILARSGAVLQDLNSIMYRDLVNMMRSAFTAKRPLLFAGGHDHALQLIETDSVDWPHFTAVSGSASKSSAVGHVAGMRFRDRAPGYMRMVTHRDGRVDLFIIAAPDEKYLHCEGEADALAQCMADRSAAFRIKYAQRLK